MTDTLKKLRIFAASPSDVATERAKLETVVASLKPTADFLGLTLEVVDWRAVVPDAGRPQQIIFDQLKPTSWDIFVGILWHRFGTPPGGKDPQTQKDYLSGTEEEFRVAYRLWKEFGKPRIVMYRCTRAIPLDTLDPDQYKLVREFFKQFEAKGEHPGLVQSFDTTESFEKLLLDNLQKLLLEYGEQSKTPITPEVAQTLAPKIPNNLPRRAAFFGRAKEMDVAMRALSPADRTWGVLVDGIGGIGKSALALEAAHRCKELEVFDAFIFVSAKQKILEPSGIRDLTLATTTLDAFVNETALALGQVGIAQLAGEGKRRALLDYLRTTRVLLVYDNLETLTMTDEETLADWLRFLPQTCKAILTSRRRSIEGAVRLRVEALDWDAACRIIENEMARDAGLATKLRRAESRWQELYDETNGSPLALVHTLGLMRVRATLTFDGALEMLRGNRDADLQKFIFQEARKELTTNDKIALSALSFFVPSATFEAWMQVANLSRNALETTIDRLSALSLVDVLAGEERYALHPLTRAFVRDELLADANIARETGMRFAQYWVEYAWLYGGGERERYKTFYRLEAEWANFGATAIYLWETAAVNGDEIRDEDAVLILNDLLDALRTFFSFSGRWDEWVQYGAWAYEGAIAKKHWQRAGWRAFDLTKIYYNRAQTADAMLWADRCTVAWTNKGDKRERAIATWMRGRVAMLARKYVEAEAILQEALALWRDVGIDGGVALVLNDLGNLARDTEHYELAERHYLKALDLIQTNKEERTNFVGNLGELALCRKQWAEARRWFAQALSLAQEIGKVVVIAHAQYGLARVQEAEGRADLALPLAQDALKIYERLQHRNLAEARELVERLRSKAPPP